MISKIVCKLEPITLVGGAHVAKETYEQAVVHGASIVAADGGAAHVLGHGGHPEAVIGDMDSIPEDVKSRLSASVLHYVTEQDSTDFEKCLMRMSAPLILGVGFLGGRMDHHLAALHSLVRFADQRCILISEHEIVFLCPAQLTLPLAAKTRVSLFPMGKVSGSGTGLKWSFDGLDFAPGLRIGTSNEATGSIALSMNAPNMLCILPISCLDHVVTALMAQGGLWPSRV